MAGAEERSECSEGGRQESSKEHKRKRSRHSSREHKHSNRRRQKRKHRRRSKKRSGSGSDGSENESSSLTKRHDRKRKPDKVVKEIAEKAASGSSGGFVWQKKLEKELESGKSVSEVKQEVERAKNEHERMQEVEKVRKRREERQAELARLEQQKENEAREKALAESEEVEEREEQQQLQQAKTRSEMRLKEGRGRNADIIARNIHGEPDTPFLDTTSVDAVFDGATAKELEELRSDFSSYVQLEAHNPRNAAFWQAMLTACDAKLKEALHVEEVDRAKLHGEKPPQRERRAGLHEAVEHDVHQMLSGKPYRELKCVEEDIRSRLKRNEFADAEYWDTVLSQLEVWIAMAYLREEYEVRRQEALHSQAGLPVLSSMEQLRPEATQTQDSQHLHPNGNNLNQETANETEDLPADEGTYKVSAEPDEAHGEKNLVANLEEANEGEEEEKEEEEKGDEEELPAEDERDEEEQKAMLSRDLSPEPAASMDMLDEYGEELEVIDEAEDAQQIDALREKISKESQPRFEAAARTAAQPGTTEQEDMLRALKDSQHVGPAGLFSNIVHKAEDATETEGERKAREKALKEMGPAKEGEFQFGEEAETQQQHQPVDASQAYWYHDKYRPRKPKYFNRVHTGFDWNKYNKTHYDRDNPPPKQVIGYKFNIFYPDLIDKSQTPKYTIEPDGSKHGETCIIRFSAGPPYEDIAFKIINRQWDTSGNKGFKCSFERGVLHLFFNFNRARYRR